MERAAALRDGGRDYPVRYEPSDTSGEKPFEEFFTEDEAVDMARFRAIGVVTGMEVRGRERLGRLLDGLERMFEGGNASKAGVVATLRDYLPNFGHIETGKSLDSRM